jgi:hypothetical protein
MRWRKTKSREVFVRSEVPYIRIQKKAVTY